MFSEDDIISVYTRAQAIEDGVLVDVTPTAKEAGFRYPVALTRAVWSEYVAVPPSTECQDETGRLWDLLWMLACAIRGSTGTTDTLHYRLYVRNDDHDPTLVTLKAVCGANDDGSPCMTVLMPHED